jgi:UrcA family protein
MFRKTIQNVFAIAALAVVLASFNAAAQSTPGNVAVDASQRGADLEVRRKVVPFADLDLSREAGVKALYQRIKAAAESVCSPLRRTRSLTMEPGWRDCLNTAVANAVADIDHPRLTELHRLSTPRAG